MRVTLISILLLSSCVVPKKGVDISNPATDLECVLSFGLTWVAVNVYKEDGHVYPSSVSLLRRAKTKGLETDIYLDLC